MKAFGIALALLLLGSAAALLLDCPASARDVARSARESLFRGGPDGVRQAVEGFRRALEKDAASPYRWCDVGEALLEVGDVEGARRCFRRAFRLGANVPPVLLRIANFHFRVNEPAPALQATSQILATISDYDAVVFSSYSALVGDADAILARGIPRDRRAAQAWFHYLLSRGSRSDTATAWRWLQVHSFTDDRLAARYVDFLLANKSCDAAAAVWSAHLGSRRGDYPNSNSVFNGGFELEPTGARLDWRIGAGAGFEAARAPEGARSGRFVLRIRFQGTENVEFRHVSQTTVVKPGAYRFVAWTCAEGITTDQGLTFRIFDPEVPARLDILTEPLLGTRDWKPVRRAFRIPASTRLIEIQLARLPSLKFDNKISGTVRIDDVVLSPAQ